MEDFTQAWAKANSVGNILSDQKFTGAPVFSAIAAGRVEDGHPVFNDVDLVKKYPHNISAWIEKCGKFLSAVLTPLGDALQQHLRQLQNNFIEGNKENITKQLIWLWKLLVATVLKDMQQCK